MSCTPNDMNRRTFLKTGPLGAAAVAAGLSHSTAAAQQPDDTEPAPGSLEEAGPGRRILGRTRMKVSMVGIGTNKGPEPAVLRFAFDRGVNYVDTARRYRGGRSELNVGKAIKGRRDKVYVVTKIPIGDTASMRRHAEESLKALATDYVDVFLMHGARSKEVVMNEDLRELMSQLRKEGKARFLGVSTHNEVEVLDAVAQDPDKLFDVVLARYNFKSDKKVKEAIARAAKAGVGVVAMKTQAGGYKTKELGDISPHQAALKWVLQNKNVTLAVPCMVNLDEVKENTQVLGMKFARVDQQILERYGKAIAPYYCRGCGECLATCPKSVDIPTVNRCLMYVEGYCDMDLAREAYARLAKETTAAVCTECAECVAECVHEVRVARNMRMAHRILA